MKNNRSLIVQLVPFGLVSLILLAFVSVIGASIGVPFTIWYDDCGLLLLIVGSILLFYGVSWDVIIIATWLLSRTLSKFRSDHKYTPLKTLWKDIGFFGVGIVPVLIIVFTSYVILETSNITIISLKLSGSLISWKDPFLWSIEKEVFYILANLRPNPFFWDILYNSAWTIELFAMFLLILLSRNHLIVLKFCLSFILLFYIGRLLGLLNPVKGPAFYQPDLFSYLEGTFSLKAMLEIIPIMGADPLSLKSGVLVGGVSAMPSLHIGMVSVTSYWLSANVKLLRFITPFWVILVWISTVLLGWHYILDGLGGIILALICILLTKALFRSFEGIRENEQRS